MLMIKHCNECGKDKLITEFYKKTSTKDGYNYLCKTCDAAKRSKLRFKNITETLQKERDSSNKYKENNPCRLRALTTYGQHKKSEKIMNITVDEIETLFLESDICPLCGIKYNKQYGNGRNNNSQSLDRIDNSIEMNIENVWVICYRCNVAKGNMKLKDFINYCKRVGNYGKC